MAKVHDDYCEKANIIHVFLMNEAEIMRERDQKEAAESLEAAIAEMNMDKLALLFDIIKAA